MNYIIRYWYKVKDAELRLPHLYIIDNERELLELLNRARNEKIKIDVFELGEQLLDWSD